MNQDEFEGNWHLLKGKVQEKWGKFTNDEITELQGKYEKFLGKLQMKYGYTKEQAEREIKNWNEEHLKKGYTGVTRFWDPERHPNKSASKETKAKKPKGKESSKVKKRKAS